LREELGTNVAAEASETGLNIPININEKILENIRKILLFPNRHKIRLEIT